MISCGAEIKLQRCTEKLSEASVCSGVIVCTSAYDTGRLSERCAQGDPAVTPRGERWSNPPAQLSLATPPTATSSPSQTPLGWTLGGKSTPDQHCQPGGNRRAVSSPPFICTGDLWTCFASLFLYVMIKYCLSAQLIPEAKGKSLCPQIICKLSLSPRTDLFAGGGSVLCYPAVTLPLPFGSL